MIQYGWVLSQCVFQRKIFSGHRASFSLRWISLLVPLTIARSNSIDVLSRAGAFFNFSNLCWDDFSNILRSQIMLKFGKNGSIADKRFSRLLSATLPSMVSPHPRGKFPLAILTHPHPDPSPCKEAISFPGGIRIAAIRTLERSSHNR